MDDFFRIDTLSGMSQIDKKELLLAMKEAGTAAAPLALQIGRDKDYIRDYLKGRKKSLKVEDAQNIADALQIPLARLIGRPSVASDDLGMEVVGKVAAGLYKDITIENQDTERARITFARDLRFPHARQYALEVEGDSMDERFPDGSYVVCVDFIESGLDLRDGMAVHVEREAMGGQFIETTLKEVYREGKGRFILKPRSSNPSHKPLVITGSDGDEIKIRGIVIGEWKPIFFGF